MYAIIEIGKKQYKVEVGDKIFVDRLDVKENESFSFNNVVAVVDEDKLNFGTPFINGATVVGNILKNGKGKKIRVFKYKPKKNYSRRYGHRQQYTKVEITNINV